MTTHTLDAKHLDKCGHAGCKCLVDPGESYCGTHCEHADTQAEQSPQETVLACQCGHAECK